ncbi:MAG: hypothetical protein E6I43_01875 [Chloroflexi bacterium]|nr:MAG: hypothetical protein E6I43_01875 [Chloroflexota bacterium]
MGCACLRGDGHRWPVRGAGRIVARRRQQGGIAHQPHAVGAHARPQLLRRGGDTDAVRLGDCEAQPDPDPDTVGIGQPIGDGDRQRLGDSLPIAVGDRITVAERQRETLGLALGPL